MNLSMIAGDTRQFVIPIVDEDGYPIDASDVEFTARLGPRFAPVINKVLGDGVVDNDDGTCTVTLDPADTDAITTRRRYSWDVQIVDEYDEAIRTVARGYLWVEVQVTT